MPPEQQERWEQATPTQRAAIKTAMDALQKATRDNTEILEIVGQKMSMVFALRPDPDHKHLETRWQALQSAKEMSEQQVAALWAVLEDLRAACAVLDQTVFPPETLPNFAGIESAIRLNEEHLKMVTAAWEKEDKLHQAVLSLREKKERLRVLQRQIEEMRRKKDA